MTNVKYDIAALRDLLEAAFTAEKLRTFCEERPFLSPVLVDLPSGFSLAVIVDQVIERCRTHDQFSKLVAEVKAYNPEQYDNFAGQLHITKPSPDQADISPEEQRLGAVPLSAAHATHGQSEAAQPAEQPQPSDVPQPPAPVPPDQDWGKALRDWLGLIVAVVAGFFSWLLKDNLGAAGVGWVVFIVAAVSWWYSVIRRIPRSRLGFQIRSVRVPVWRAWFLLAVKGTVLLVILALAGVWGWLLWQAAQPYITPQFEITALDTLEGDSNAYEVTDMLIWNQSNPEEYGVGITFTLEIRPIYFGNRKLGEVVARISGEGGALPDKTLWDDFSSDSGTTKIYLSLPEVLQASGLGLNSEPSHNPFGPGDLLFEEAGLTIQVTQAADPMHPWASEMIAIRNAPWELRSERIWRNENHEVDVYVENLGGTGEFTVRYHLVRLEKDIGPGLYPMTSGVTTVEVWNAPEKPVRLEKGESFTDTVSLPTGLFRGRHLLEVYAVKTQNYVQFKDPNTTWEDLDTLESPWWFGRFPADIHIFVETSSIPVDETIEAEWKRLRDEEGIDLGHPTGTAEAVTSVDGEGNPRTEGLRQVFEGGEIYQRDGQAYALYGQILQKYKQWGELQSHLMGFPISPIRPVTSSLGTKGVMVQLEGHPDWPPSAIYSSTKSVAATWPWIGAVYSEDFGGHTGWLGFPLTDEQDYSNSTLQMFERGYIVYYFPRVGEDRDWNRTPVAYPYRTSFGTIFEVQAVQEWQDAGIQVESGAHIAIVQIADEWSWDGTSRTTDANGDHKWTISPNAPLPSAYMGSLVGRIGQGEDQVFPVGRWREYTSPAQGNLYLMVNDDQLDDNTGFVTVQITIQAAE